MRFAQKNLEVAQGPERGINAKIIRYVVSVVTLGRWVKGQQPYCGGAKAFDVIQLLGQSLEIADAVAIAVKK